MTIMEEKRQELDETLDTLEKILDWFDDEIIFNKFLLFRIACQQELRRRIG